MESVNFNDGAIPVRGPGGSGRYLRRESPPLIRRVFPAAEVGGNELADAPPAQTVFESDPDGAPGFLRAVLEEIDLLDVKAGGGKRGEADGKKRGVGLGEFGEGLRRRMAGLG